MDYCRAFVALTLLLKCLRVVYEICMYAYIYVYIYLIYILPFIPFLRWELQSIQTDHSIYHLYQSEKWCWCLGLMIIIVERWFILHSCMVFEIFLALRIFYTLGEQLVRFWRLGKNAEDHRDEFWIQLEWNELLFEEWSMNGNYCNSFSECANLN